MAVEMVTYIPAPSHTAWCRREPPLANSTISTSIERRGFLYLYHILPLQRPNRGSMRANNMRSALIYLLSSFHCSLLILGAGV